MDNVTVVATGLRFPEGPVCLNHGDLALVEIAGAALTRIDSSGSKRTMASLAGGPNGAACGPDGAIYVCNNGGMRTFVDEEGITRTDGATTDYRGGWVERVDPATGQANVIYASFEGAPLLGPNDLVFDHTGGFYFTDAGKRWNHGPDSPRYRFGAIYYARHDGSSIARIAGNLQSPNGIGLSPDESILYYAETEGGRLWAFDLAGPGCATGSARFIAHAGGASRLDSLAVDAEGNVSVATLGRGGISTFSPEGRLVDRVEIDDPLVTNICFGGPALRTAFITSSGRGQLLSMAWRRPGLRLNFSLE